MKPLALALFTAFSLRAQTPGLYPQVRALVLEAEAASANMLLLKDRGNPHTWAGDILAHAGYLEDAERAYAKSPGPSADPPYILWRAWVVYGRRERAEKLLESATSAEKKAGYFASFADLLWRTGEARQARARYEAARAIAVKIVDPPSANKCLRQSIKVSGSYPIRLRTSSLRLHTRDPGSAFRTHPFRPSQ